MTECGANPRFEADIVDRMTRRAPATIVRLWPLVAAAVAAASVPASGAQALAAASGAGPRLQPGLYLSESVVLTLQPGGLFLVQELGGTRHASGRYTAAPGRLTFAAGEGDVGKTRFPLTCRLVAAFDGFAVAPGQAACKPFSGLSFRAAN